MHRQCRRLRQNVHNTHRSLSVQAHHGTRREDRSLRLLRLLSSFHQPHRWVYTLKTTKMLPDRTIRTAVIGRNCFPAHLLNVLFTKPPIAFGDNNGAATLTTHVHMLGESEDGYLQLP